MCLGSLSFDIRFGILNIAIFISMFSPIMGLVVSSVGFGSYYIYNTPVCYDWVVCAGIYLTWQYLRTMARIGRIVEWVGKSVYQTPDDSQHQILHIDIVSNCLSNCSTGSSDTIRTSGMSEFSSMVETEMILNPTFVDTHSAIVCTTKGQIVKFDRCTDLNTETIQNRLGIVVIE